MIVSKMVAVVLGLSLSASSVLAQTRESFVGLRRLVSCESRDSARVVLRPFGEHPVGQIVYDADGNMSTILVKPNRPLFASKDRRRGTNAEIRAALEGFDSYFGTYTVDTTTQTVIHHVVGAVYPNWVGTDQLRYYKFEGLRLVLSTPPFQLGGRLLTTVCVFERSPLPPSNTR